VRDYPRIVRALRNVAVIAVVLLAVASAATLAVASRAGSAHSDSGQGQYGTKPDCRPYHSKHSSKHHSKHGRKHHGRRGGCPKPGRHHHSWR
jgi:hypothetical protein